MDTTGGCSILNIWQPAVDEENGEIMSLSQEWYTAGSGTGIQTVECGWNVYPQLYGDMLPHFFIYWTADGYQTTGCYNLTCSAFVQVGSSFTPGQALSQISVSGGQQYSILLACGLETTENVSAWWVWVQGPSQRTPMFVGYYPLSLYNSGPLATNATYISYGGEVAGQTNFPPMGSGALADQGVERAAFQTGCSYLPINGKVTVPAELTLFQPSACYTVQLRSGGGDPSFFFGGPGGTNCQDAASH